jgi:hypothetical protein
MATKPWWEFPFTQGYRPPSEYGVDVGTPLDTPLTAIFGGVVTRANYNPWGGEVDIKTAKGLTEYFLHLDQIAPGIAPGAKVSPGQLLGLSGGQLSGGAHPTAAEYSSGPHVEYGLFSGSWGVGTVDPTAIVKAGAPLAGASSGPLGGFDPTDPLGTRTALWNYWNSLGDLSKAANVPTFFGLDPTDPLGTRKAVTDLGHGAADFFSVSESNLSEWLKRQSIAFFVAAIVLLVLFH